ncbi:MAG: hypothetical protein HY246_05710 [Proteobacteria bacterium]|nr:hypothetical protein [Pseudomonadota bacterium]
MTQTMTTPLSRRSIQTLLDLVENKLTAMEVVDREDARVLSILEYAREELLAMCGSRTTPTDPDLQSLVSQPEFANAQAARRRSPH